MSHKTAHLSSKTPQGTVDMEFAYGKVPGSSALRNQGTKEPRNQGTKEPRNQGTKEPRNQGTKELWAGNRLCQSPCIEFALCVNSEAIWLRQIVQVPNITYTDSFSFFSRKNTGLPEIWMFRVKDGLSLWIQTQSLPGTFGSLARMPKFQHGFFVLC
jgi:hypothetical protein